jgi:hypothetical protein
MEEIMDQYKTKHVRRQLVGKIDINDTEYFCKLAIIDKDEFGTYNAFQKIKYDKLKQDISNMKLTDLHSLIYSYCENYLNKKVINSY